MANNLPPELQSWLNDFRQIKLPVWQDFPKFDIYMDQLVSLVNQYLAPFELDPVTPAMINNYVKHKVMFKPVKKKYQRTHLAAVIVLSILKTAFPLDMIRLGFAQELNAVTAQEAYDRFVRLMTQKLTALTLEQPVQPVETATVFSWDAAIQQTAATTVIYQLVSEKIMILAREEYKNDPKD
ncbi:DUF1836 domain-containing protein [Loigolactobacillus backii]|uniref:DUF1836 domain-containing protein n=1 Tax=Loigolactobacillus backii TaxID=375175 RepID=UPI001EE6BA64|nr:DUF1836 domain-containing protein [Loigolactobacillus backii]